MSEVKCPVLVVKDKSREEMHSREELGFSLHKEEKKTGLFFHCILFVVYPEAKNILTLL